MATTVTTQQNIQWRWLKLAQQYTNDKKLINKLFKKLDAKYSASGRHYHNWRHISSMLEDLDAFHDEISDLNAVKWAIFYHDAVYSPFRKNNEEKSAELAAKHMQKLAIDEETISKVQRMIIRTKNHYQNDVTDDNDTFLLLDLDLSILSVSDFEYELYTQKIRKEYSWVPGFTYKSKRKVLLQQYLNAERIYRTATFQHLETAARENLQREISLL